MGYQHKSSSDILGKLSEKFSKFLNLKTLGVFLVLLFLYSSINYNPEGVSTRIKQPFMSVVWKQTDGFYFKLPLVSRKSSYNQIGTLSVTDDKSLIKTSSVHLTPVPLTFADSYQVRVEWSLRYAISSDPQELEEMHKDSKGQTNLLGNTLMPFANTLVKDSVNQLLGSNFAQGGQNALRTLINDQSQYGMYKTRVESVSSELKVGSSSNTKLGSSKEGINVTKVVYLEGEDGKKLRLPLSIAQYKIKVVPESISIIEATPIGRLAVFIENKQKSLGLQIKQDEEQKLLTKKAKTAQLAGDVELIERTNSINIEKQTSILNQEKAVAVAKLLAEKEIVEKEKAASLAIIDKERELQEAKANEGIQKATAIAAKYQAQAIKEVGFAEAQVDAAKFKAKEDNKEIYLAELRLKGELAMAEVLPKTSITLPQIVMQGGGSNGDSGGAIGDLLSTRLVQDMVKSQDNKGQ